MLHSNQQGKAGWKHFCMGACTVWHRRLPAVFRAGGQGRLRWGSSCCVPEASSHLGNRSSQASGKGRSAMAWCRQGALDLVFQRGFLSCKHGPTRVSAFHIVHARFICGRAGDRHVGRHGCGPAACLRLRSGLGQLGLHVHACAYLSLAGLSPLLGHQRARGRRREPRAPAQPQYRPPSGAAPARAGGAGAANGFPGQSRWRQLCSAQWVWPISKTDSEV